MERKDMEKDLIEIKEIDLKRHYKCNKEEDYVFVSYSSKDKLLVWNIVKSLMDDGFNIFIDKANLNATQEYDRQLMDAASSSHCKYCLFFNSENSLISSQVQKEMEKARIRQVMNIFIFNQTGFFRTQYQEQLKNEGGENFYIFSRICENTNGIEKANGLILQEQESYRDFIEMLEFELEENIGIYRRATTTANDTTFVDFNSSVRNKDIDSEITKKNDNIYEVELNHTNNIENDKDESNNVDDTSGGSVEEQHNAKVKECVLKEIEKYKNEGKLVSVGNSKSMFTTKALNDYVKCSEFDNNKTTTGNLIGYIIGFYGLNKYSWSTFAFNLGVENIESKGIVKDRVISLIEARDKLNKDGTLENLLKEAKDKGLLVKVNYNNTFGKNSTNLLTIRYDDTSEDENVLIKNIDSALDWMEKFESNLLNVASKSK